MFSIASNLKKIADALVQVIQQLVALNVQMGQVNEELAKIAVALKPEEVTGIVVVPGPPTVHPQ